MPEPVDPKDTQPLANDNDKNNREYVPAVWQGSAGGTRSSKLSGGYEINKRTGVRITTRGYNRPDQRYSLAQTEKQRRVLANATAEYANTVILQGANSRYEVRGVSGNNYDVSANLFHCDCPDWLKQEESGYGIVRCKHIVMVAMALQDSAYPNGLDWSTDKIAECCGYQIRTIQAILQAGDIISIATKQHKVWRVRADVAEFLCNFLSALVVRFPNETGD